MKTKLLYASLAANIALVLLAAVFAYTVEIKKAENRTVLTTERQKTEGAHERLTQLQNKLTRAEAELRLTESRLHEADATAVELEQQLTAAADEQAALIEQLMPPIILPEDRRSMGEATGRLRRLVAAFVADFPERPAEDTVAFELYANRLDEMMREYVPVLLKQDDFAFPENRDAAMRDYVSGNLSATLALDEHTAARVDEIVRFSYEQAKAKKLLGVFDPFAPDDEARRQWRIERAKISLHAADQLKNLLTPEQLALFNESFSGESFLYDNYMIHPYLFTALVEPRGNSGGCF